MEFTRQEHLFLSMEKNGTNFSKKDLEELKEFIVQYNAQVLNLMAYIRCYCIMNGKQLLKFIKEVRQKEEEISVSSFKKSHNCLDRFEHLVVIQRLKETIFKDIPFRILENNLKQIMLETYMKDRHITQKEKIYKS